MYAKLALTALLVSQIASAAFLPDRRDGSTTDLTTVPVTTDVAYYNAADEAVLQARADPRLKQHKQHAAHPTKAHKTKSHKGKKVDAALKHLEGQIRKHPEGHVHQHGTGHRHPEGHFHKHASGTGHGHPQDPSRQEGRQYGKEHGPKHHPGKVDHHAGQHGKAGPHHLGSVHHEHKHLHYGTNPINGLPVGPVHHKTAHKAHPTKKPHLHETYSHAKPHHTAVHHSPVHGKPHHPSVHHSPVHGKPHDSPIHHHTSSKVTGPITIIPVHTSKISVPTVIPITRTKYTPPPDHTSPQLQPSQSGHGSYVLSGSGKTQKSCPTTSTGQGLIC